MNCTSVVCGGALISLSGPSVGKEEQDQSSATTLRARSPALGRASLLLVDDNPARLLSYEAILYGLGVHCVRALSGEEALERLLEREFAAVLLDICMPGMDGFEVARLIRQVSRCATTPIIFVTGLELTDLDQLKGYEVGAIDYLRVPVVPELLRSRVATLVELYQRRGELQAVNEALAEARTRLAEHATVLAERDAQLHASFEHPTNFTVVLNSESDASGAIKDWIYVNANANALQLLGRAREALIGRRLSEVFPERAQDISEHCRRALRTGELVHYECRFADKDLLVTLYPAAADSLMCSLVDITERKRSDAALRASEARYRALIDNAPAAVAHNAMSGHFQYANKAFCRLVDYTAEELLTKTWQEITHPDDLKSDQSLGNRVLAGEISHYMLEKRYVRKDGTSVWVEMFGNFVLDDDGRPVQGVAIALDITARRRADMELRDSRERLLLAKAAARLGTHDWDIVTGAIQWDERTCELWGIDASEQVTYDLFIDGLHPDDRHSTQAAVDRALDPAGDGEYFVTYRVINRRDRATRWVKATGRVAFEHGRAVRMVGTVEDVTERTLAEANLRASEERFRELANNIDQLVWTCDRLGLATWYNDRWFEYTGGTLADMRADGWKKVHHPAHIERVITRLQRHLETGQPWEDTFPLRGKDGQYRWFLSRAIPIRDESGRVIRWFGTNTDVTEQRRLQDALEDNDRRKDEFLAMLAHELRNPVAPIVSAAEALEGLLSPDGKESTLVRVIQRQSTHLARLLDDLLDIGRITQGRIVLQRERMPLRACIDLAIETTQPMFRERGYRLKVTHASQSLAVDGDQVRLAQCVTNLLSNAAKYTAPGGEIRVRSCPDGNDAMIEVIDTGIGISAEFLPKVFDLFAQADTSLDRSEGGLGVGLSVCRRLVEMHGGTVMAHSAGLGHGATFTIRLPLVREPVQAPTILPETLKVSHRVMIVDDNQDAADVIALLLQIEGHQTLVVYSSEDALAGVVAFHPDVVLLDIGLPKLDGYEVARRMKRIVPSARLIAVSGYGQREDKKRSSDAGFEAHLVKPVDLPTLKKLFVESTPSTPS